MISRLLHMLHEADPTDLENDPEELLHLEGKKYIKCLYFSLFKKEYILYFIKVQGVCKSTP